MNRWLALLLAIVGGAFVAVGFVFGSVAALTGILWIWVFGDDVWPAWVDPVLSVIIFGGGLALWALVAWHLWSKLRRPA